MSQLCQAGSAWVRAGSVLLVTVLALYIFATDIAPVRHVDTSAFYCGARVLYAGGDPYRFQPLHGCEARTLNLNPNEVYPDPLPPYAIAMWLPLALLTFAQANLLWLLTLLVSAFVIAWSVVKLTGFPPWLVGLCVIAATLVEPLANGGMAPVPTALLCAAAVALVCCRYSLVAILLGLACMQPHVALPAILSVFILIPAMRLRLIAVGIAVAVVSLIAGGWLNAEYLMAVLPSHAMSEFNSSNQYSLSAMLHLLGVSNGVALTAGSLQYAIFLVLGILLASQLRRDVPAAVVLAPLTCAVTGGTFIHQTEIAGALPFAFLMAARLPTFLAWAGVALVALPLEYLLDYGGTIIAGLVVFAILLFRRSTEWINALLLGFSVSAILAAAHIRFPLHFIAVPSPFVSGHAFAEEGWKPMQDRFPAENVLWWPSHLLTYAGLALIYWCAIEIVRNRKIARASVRASLSRLELPEQGAEPA